MTSATRANSAATPKVTIEAVHHGGRHVAAPAQLGVPDAAPKTVTRRPARGRRRPAG